MGYMKFLTENLTFNILKTMQIKMKHLRKHVKFVVFIGDILLIDRNGNKKGHAEYCKFVEFDEIVH